MILAFFYFDAQKAISGHKIDLFKELLNVRMCWGFYLPFAIWTATAE